MSNEKMIKGRIAETIFEEMFSEGSDYTIIPFGYEKVIPALAKARRRGLNPTANKVVDNISSAPDYALIKDKSVYLVEVKFYNTLIQKEVIKLAENQKVRWDPSCLFIVTPSVFYFGKCEEILKRGYIEELPEEFISKSIQQKFLKLVKKFEK